MPFSRTACASLTLALLLPLGASAASVKLPTPRPGPARPYRQGLAEVQVLARQGQVEEAYARTRALRDSFPREIDVQMAYLQLAFAARHGEEAQAEYQRLATERPTDPVALYMYAVVGPDSSRRAFVERAIAADPKYAPAHVGLAGIVLHATPPDTAGAIAELLKAVKLDPTAADPWSYLGYVLLARRDLDTAARAFEGAAVADTAWCYSGLPGAAKRLVDAGASRAALSLLDRIPAGRPDWVDYNIGAMYVQAGRPAKAFEINDRLVATAASEDVRAWYLYCRATLHAQMHNADSTFAVMERAIDAGFADSTRFEKDTTWGNYWTPLVSDARMSVIRTRIAEVNAERLRATAGQRREAVLSTRIDQALPSFGLREPLTGKAVSLDQYKGQVVVLDFWATWCGPCRRTMPLLNDFTKAQAGKKVAVLSAQIFERTPDAEQKARTLFDSNGYTMRHIVANDEAGDLLGFNSIPTLYIVGPNGRIAFKHVGYSPSMAEELGWQVDALLGDSH